MYEGNVFDLRTNKSLAIIMTRLKEIYPYEMKAWLYYSNYALTMVNPHLITINLPLP